MRQQDRLAQDITIRTEGIISITKSKIAETAVRQIRDNEEYEILVGQHTPQRFLGTFGEMLRAEGDIRREMSKQYYEAKAERQRKARDKWESEHTYRDTVLSDRMTMRQWYDKDGSESITEIVTTK